MSDQLSEAYWASLGENGLFLWSLLESQQQQLQHLHQQNQHLLTHFDNFQNNLANAASTAAVAAVQHIVIPTSPNISSTHSIKAADLEIHWGQNRDRGLYSCYQTCHSYPARILSRWANKDPVCPLFHDWRFSSHLGPKRDWDHHHQ